MGSTDPSFFDVFGFVIPFCLFYFDMLYCAVTLPLRSLTSCIIYMLVFSSVFNIYGQARQDRDDKRINGVMLDMVNMNETSFYTLPHMKV